MRIQRNTFLAWIVALATAMPAVSLEPTTAVAQKRKRESNGKKEAPKSRIPRGPANAGTPPIAKVSPRTLADVQRSAAAIDALVEKLYGPNDVTPRPLTTDAQFLRRACLQITGSIPTLEQTQKFLKSRDAKRRSKLIDELLNSEGYVSHHFNYWGNILRLVDRPVNNAIVQPFHEWIKQALRDNMPYDQFVREMLTASGKTWENGATGYLMRDPNMPLDATNNTVRIFLGTRIGCAQCHDHPFDRWTQREFYEMAAYMYSTRTKNYGGNKKDFDTNPVKRLKDELKEIDPDHNGGGDFNRVIQANLFDVFDQSRRLRLPHDYQYHDAKPKQAVSYSPIFEPEAPVRKGGSSREAFADWMTSRDNPRFARTISNRLWKHAMGIGLIEPVDDLRDDSTASNPELMALLEREMIRLNFDMKQFLRIICNTKTWQRQVFEDDVDFSQPYYFPGPLLRRMTAEQAWDSLLTLAVYNVDGFRRTSFDEVGDVVELDLNKATAQDVLDRAEQYKEEYSNGAMRKADRAHSYKGMTLARASELPLPAPADHFLRQFGQGDRELIEGATTDGSVSQILTMFNGPVTHMMLERGSVIYDNVVSAKPADRVPIIFYSVLNRKPTSSELTIAREEIRLNRNAGYGNVIWALVNTKEFLFIQ